MRKYLARLRQSAVKCISGLCRLFALDALKAQFLRCRTDFYFFLRKVPLPNTIVIDPSNICNLKCPLCPTGLNRLNYDRSFMSLENFYKIIQNIEGVKNICMFNWGEPFLNPETIDMISFAKKLCFNVIIHSNFSLRKDDGFFENLARTGLDELYLSLDGASPETYSKYKVGGDFELVISNVRKLIEVKEKLHTGKPEIIWKFIVNKYNEGEIEKARKMAQGLGIKFILANIGLSDDLPDFKFESSVKNRKQEWLPSSKEYIHQYYLDDKLPLYAHRCDQLVTLLVVNPDGKVFPCCWVTDRENVFGDLLKDKLENIWNNSKYAYSRSLFVRRRCYVPGEGTVCSICSNFKKAKGV